MEVIQLYPIIQIVKSLKNETMYFFKHCQTIKGIKVLTDIYEILEITDKINMRFNNPINKGFLVYDASALNDLVNDVRLIYVYNDPSRAIINPYLDRTKKMFEYYKNYERIQSN